MLGLCRNIQQEAEEEKEWKVERNSGEHREATGVARPVMERSV